MTRNAGEMALWVRGLVAFLRANCSSRGPKFAFQHPPQAGSSWRRSTFWTLRALSRMCGTCTYMKLFCQTLTVHHFNPLQTHLQLL